MSYELKFETPNGTHTSRGIAYTESELAQINTHIDRLEMQNEKLRELVKEAYTCRTCRHWHLHGDCTGCGFIDRVNELGIEVDE